MTIVPRRLVRLESYQVGTWKTSVVELLHLLLCFIFPLDKIAGYRVYDW